MLKTERKRDFYEAAYLQYFLWKEGCLLVYVDEFHLNLRSDSLYNWSPRNVPAMLAIEPNPWTMSFIVAISGRGIEGIKAANYSIESQIFIWFIEDIWKRLLVELEHRKGPVIIFDNASLHMSKDSTSFLINKGIC